MSGIYSVSYSTDAKTDLKGVYSYISSVLHARKATESQVNRIREAIRSLNHMPYRNPAVDWEPWKNKGMRKMPVDNFIIFYVVDENERKVSVVRIVYGGRDVESLAVSEDT